MNARKRHYLAQLVCDYLAKQNIEVTQVTARDIVNFHHLPRTYSHSISAVLKHLYYIDAKKNDYGFSVVEREGLKGDDAPYRFTIQVTKQHMVIER